MLEKATVAARLPAQDLERARRFYSEKLGLEPAEERRGGLLYRCGGIEFGLFQSAGEPSGAHTQMGWEVDDIEAVVEELRSRGVVFEEYDLPGLTTVDGIAEVEGTTRARAARENGPPGSATARGTCSAWDSRFADQLVQLTGLPVQAPIPSSSSN